MFQKLILLAFILLLTGCGTKDTASPESNTMPNASEPAVNTTGSDETSLAFFAMDTYMTIRAYGADDILLERAQTLVDGLESELSATRETSAIHLLNQNGSAEFSENAAHLLSRVLELCRKTGGALDISIYPIVKAWGFTSADKAYRVPQPEEIKALLEKVDYTRVSLDHKRVSLPSGVEIDLGAVTKGYAGDQIASLLRSGGVESALLDLGGNIQAVGAKPDGGNWRVAIQNPEGNGILGILSIANQAVITSGGYERYFIDDNGHLWWHIMDPSTGYPAQNGLISVTVVGNEGLYCDALSTALFIMGPERAITFWSEHRDFEMALVTDSDDLLLTPGLAEIFTPADQRSYEIDVIQLPPEQQMDAK